MKIAVVGSLNMDMVVHADRIPRRGETVCGDGVEFNSGGKGANQAAAIAKLGADVTMYGCVGEDEPGEKLVENLRKCGVKTDGIEVLPGVPTGQAMITVGDGDNTIVIIAGANERVDAAYLERKQSGILEADIIVLQNEIPEKSVEHIIRLGSEHRKIVVWNPAPARAVKEELMDLVSFITPNEHEASVIWGEEAEDLDTLLRKYPGKLLVTQGEKGVGVCLDGEVERIPAMKTDVVDTTGAGDTLNGAFCAALAMGIDERNALRFANIAAGLSVQKEGAQGGMPSLKEVWEVEESHRKVTTHTP